jgi:flagellar basal body-associated protein FliL
MVEARQGKPTPDRAAPAADGPEPKTEAVAWTARLKQIRRISLAAWVVILVVASIVLHAAALAYSRMSDNGEEKPEAEISLGVFRYVGPPAASDGVGAAEFSLFVRLIDQFDRAGRERLAERRHRVQQDIEQLLRLAHSGDFDDPKLGELKRQLQEQINESLGMRAIAEVMITDLDLQYAGQATPGSTAAAPTPLAGDPSG